MAQIMQSVAIMFAKNIKLLQPQQLCCQQMFKWVINSEKSVISNSNIELQILWKDLWGGQGKGECELLENGLN